MSAQEETGKPATATWLASVRQSLDAVAHANDAHDRLVAVAQVGRYVDHLTAELVATARSPEEPLSWAQIGGALGMTRQAANERFSEAGQRGALHRRYRRARRTADLRARAGDQAAASHQDQGSAGSR